MQINFSHACKLNPWIKSSQDLDQDQGPRASRDSQPLISCMEATLGVKGNLEPIFGIFSLSVTSPQPLQNPYTPPLSVYVPWLWELEATMPYGSSLALSTLFYQLHSACVLVPSPSRCSQRLHNWSYLQFLDWKARSWSGGCIQQRRDNPKLAASNCGATSGLWFCLRRGFHQYGECLRG